jgi:hypothetical protein
MQCEVMFQFAVFQSLGRSDDIVAVLEQVCDVLECPSQKCSQAVPMLGHGMCLVAKRTLERSSSLSDRCAESQPGTIVLMSPVKGVSSPQRHLFASFHQTLRR